MKTRSGFVSNSSSTSFTIIVTPKAFDAARAAVSKDAQKLMDEAWPNPAAFKVGKQTLWDISYIDHDGGYWQQIGENVVPEKDVDEDGFARIPVRGEMEGMDHEEAYNLGKEIIKALKEKGAYIREECC